MMMMTVTVTAMYNYKMLMIKMMMTKMMMIKTMQELTMTTMMMIKTMLELMTAAIAIQATLAVTHLLVTATLISKYLTKITDNV